MQCPDADTVNTASHELGGDQAGLGAHDPGEMSATEMSSSSPPAPPDPCPSIPLLPSNLCQLMADLQPAVAGADVTSYMLSAASHRPSKQVH